MVGLAIGVLTFSPRWCEEVQATEPETPALDELIKRFAAEERARCLASAWKATKHAGASAISLAY
jgi:hypothetical protein